MQYILDCHNPFEPNVHLTCVLQWCRLFDCIWTAARIPFDIWREICWLELNAFSWWFKLVSKYLAHIFVSKNSKLQKVHKINYSRFGVKVHSLMLGMDSYVRAKYVFITMRPPFGFIKELVSELLLYILCSLPFIRVEVILYFWLGKCANECY